MNDREQFEAEPPKEVKSGNFTDVFYTNNEYDAAYDGWQTCSNIKQSELDKANARIAQLEEALLVWQGNDIGIVESFEIGKKALLESSDTWLSEHDKAVEVRVLESVVKKESETCLDALYIVEDMIESRK